MIRLLLAMRASRTLTPDRSGNCSSLATENADGSSYPRTGVNRIEGRHDLVRVVPLGGMPPKDRFVAPTLVGNHEGVFLQFEDTGAGSPSRPLFHTGAARWATAPYPSNELCRTTRFD